MHAFLSGAAFLRRRDVTKSALKLGIAMDDCGPPLSVELQQALQRAGERASKRVAGHAGGGIVEFRLLGRVGHSECESGRASPRCEVGSATGWCRAVGRLVAAVPMYFAAGKLI